ncbi:MAG: O-antigen ligase family protein [Gammaproteobacteria bacterium]|nr:MAG: O-antigen ligase family protein [Gammaproteobacteria bacterium]
MTSKLEPALFAAYMAILVWAPLPFASNRIWGGALLALLVFSTLSGWLLLFMSGRARINAKVWRRARAPLALLVLVQLWVFLQLIPIPRSIVEALSPQAYAWHIKEGWLSLSLDREYGKYYLLRGCAFTTGFFLTIALVNTHDRVKTLLQVLVFSGTFQAAYGAFMVLSGLELGFFVEKYVGQGVATGTFVNRNHLAGYLVMCLSAGIGLLLSQLATESSPNWKERIRRWLRLLLSSKIRLRIYLAVMVIALVLTRARMGNIAFFTALGLAGAIALYTGRRFSARVVAFLASLFLVDMVILGKWFGFDKLLQRLEQTNPGSEARVWSNEYTLDYIRQFPLTGSGGGSFYGIFPNFQAPNLQGFHVHAHNDYLEFAAELGLPATAALIAFVALALHSAYEVQRRRHTPLYKGAAFAVTMSIVWAALHSTTDFNLQIPANALTFVTILALAFISRDLPRPRTPNPPAGGVNH